MMYLDNKKSNKGSLSDKHINPLNMPGISAIVVSDDSISSIQRFVKRLPIGLLITLSDASLFNELYYDQAINYDIVIIYTKKYNKHWGSFIKRLQVSRPARLSIFAMASEHEGSLIDFIISGADECFTQTTSDTEIKLRLYARCKESNKLILTLQSYVIIMDSDKDLIINGIRISLTLKEFKLAQMLFKKIRLTISREDLCMSIWGKEASLVRRSLDVHISRLREKLLLSKCIDLRIVSMYKKGYKMEFTSTAEEIVK